MIRIGAARAVCFLILFIPTMAGRCARKDDERPRHAMPPELAQQPRRIEAMLSIPAAWRECREVLAGGHLVALGSCDLSNTSHGSVSLSIEDCRDMTRNYAEALDTLVSRPDCTDMAVQRLEIADAAKPGAAVASDVAAAYLVRAQRHDDPLDLLRALDHADLAVQLDPHSVPARFNQALALEALGFTDEALNAWDAVRRADQSHWGTEATEHWTRLNGARSVRAATLWPLNRERLAGAVQRNDRLAVARLVAPYAAASENHIEYVLLPAWARALDIGSLQEAEQRLREAEMSASALAESTGDRYVLEAVQRIRSSMHNAARLSALRQGHALVGKANTAPLPERAELFRSAAAALRRAGSPLHHEAALDRAIAVSRQTGQLSLALQLVDAIDRDAGHYPALLARVRAQRAYCLLFKSRYVDALAEYERSLRGFEKIGDVENVANIHARKAGALRILGHYEAAWREAVAALLHTENVVALGQRHYILGESAAVAMELHQYGVALRLQNRAVDMIKDTAATLPHKNAAAIAELRRNLAIALRGRARILPHLNAIDQARNDLSEAMRLTADTVDPADESTQRVLRASLREAEAERFMVANKPQEAIASLNDALEASSQSEFRTFRASLLVKRAEAYKKIGRTAEAKRDFETAVDVLHSEEREIMQHRLRGVSEALWSLYFNRFRAAYDGLISLLVDEGDWKGAFLYAERARAFEPFSLVLQTNVAPAAFRTLSRNGETLASEQIQAELPRGTFLLEFWVSDRRTFVWILSRDSFEMVVDPVRVSQIDGWRDALHRHAADHDADAFVSALDAPYRRLLEQPLTKVENMPDGRASDRRLVIVPDRSLHALPFAVLRNPKTHRHLIEDATVSVAGSGTLFVFSLSRDEALPTSADHAALVVGDPAFDEHLEIARGLPRLKYARDEIDAIRPLYGPTALDLHDDKATASRFLRLAERSAVVHFAGHAVANPAAPFHSLLLLAPSQSHSGILDAEELMLRLGRPLTRLFVLSACSSAGGTDIGPEGLAPLVRPIITSGVPAVVGSLWNVGDNKDAKDLLVLFHSYFAGGNDAARALQLAQLELHKRSKGAHPTPQTVLAWAPFQVIGYATSPFPSGGHRRRKSS